MKIFISYRRQDSQDIAARIADRLEEMPGVREVFIDVDGIEPGADFSARIGEALDESDVCLILIGRDWVGRSTKEGQARILETEDFVRHETAASLRSGNRVIPVLLNDAPMPDKEELPADVREIVSKNAVFVRHTSFNQDIELLGDSIFLRRPRTAAGRWFRRHPLLANLVKSAGGMLLAGATLIGLAALHAELSGGKALEQTLGSRGVVWLVIGLSLLVGAALPLLLKYRR